MTALLRAELLKLRTTRTFAALVGSAVVLSLLVVGLTAAIGDDFTKEDVRLMFTGDFTSLFIVLLGVIGMAGEWRHRTITSTVLAAPDRLRLLAAKTLAYAIAGAVLSLAVTVLIMLVGTIILSARDETTASIGTLADVLWRNLLVAALVGALGVCIGAIVRNQVVAMIGLLVFAFILEPTVLGLADHVGRYGPLVGAPTGIVSGETFDSDEDLLAPGLAILVMLGWIAVAFGGAVWAFRRRDLT